MTLQAFRNAFRILITIDRDQLERALGEPLTDPDWRWFNADPIDWLQRANTPRAEALWRLIEARQPRIYRPAP